MTIIFLITPRIYIFLCYLHTKSHMYGTNIKATPAARFPMPTPKLRTTVGYCMAVYVGIMALFAPITHFAE